jgi:hypothetical protein
MPIFSAFSLRSGQFKGQKCLGSLEVSLEMAHYVVCPQKKIISRIFKISGALIVIISAFCVYTDGFKASQKLFPTLYNY